jgi:ribosome biogenesis GTPase
MKGLVISFIGSFYYVLDSQNNLTYNVSVSGALKHQRVSVYVGDDVEFTFDGSSGTIIRVYERKNKLNRPNIANVDNIAICCSTTMPEFSFELLDKFLINLSYYDIPKTIIITKIDLVSSEVLSELKDNLAYYEKTLDIRVYYLNNKDINFNYQIWDCFNHRLNALCGQSGVGKSTILNRLSSNNKIRTQEISLSLGRGKNTTTHYELHPITNNNQDICFICDTPGFLNVDIDYIKYYELKNYYPEFINNTCRYGNSCTHTHESDCSVKKDVTSGIISKIRYNNYVRFYHYLKEK